MTSRPDFFAAVLTILIVTLGAGIGYAYAEEVPEQAPVAEQAESPAVAETSDTTATEEAPAPPAEAAAEVAAATEAAPEPEVAVTTAVIEEASVDVEVEVSDNHPTIVSGDAVATANILNIVNTTVINSNGAIVLANILEDSGTIDLRSEGGQCQLLQCGVSGVEVRLLSDAEIQNVVAVQALSGENAISGGESGAIQSGNAFAGLNLVNIANSTFIDSNYLLITINAFRDVNGDIVLPPIASFFGGGLGGEANIDWQADAAASTSVQVTAESGENTLGAAGTTQTGDAVSMVNVVNQINTLLMGGDSLSLVFRVHGNWTGEVFGAPLPMSTRGGAYAMGTSGAGGGPVSVSGTSTAAIGNDVQLGAVSGRNSIEDTEGGRIETGSSYAAANIVNVANATIVGRNWILAIINIFGDFNGNISFGRPDLWVGGQVEVPGFVGPGTEVGYKMTLINRGDALASEVALEAQFAGDQLEILSASLPYVLEGGMVVWDIGNLPPGSATEITYRARVRSVSPGVDVPTTLRAALRESDNNTADNSEVLTLRTTFTGHPVGWIIPQPTAGQVLGSATKKYDSTKLFNVEVVRLTPELDISEAATEATQQVIIRNRAGRALSDVAVRDRLVAPDGTKLHDEIWDLGALGENEEVVIEYTIAFASDATPGRYVLTTDAGGEGGSLISFPSNGSILVAARVVPEVLAAKVRAPAPVVVARKEPVRQAVAALIPTAYAAGADAAPAAQGTGGLALMAALIALLALGYLVVRAVGSKGELH